MECREVSRQIRGGNVADQWAAHLTRVVAESHAVRHLPLDSHNACVRVIARTAERQAARNTNFRLVPRKGYVRHGQVIDNSHPAELAAPTHVFRDEATPVVYPPNVSWTVYAVRSDSGDAEAALDEQAGLRAGVCRSCATVID
ncbi:hypothetical protein D3C85_1306030 [compost metagenome]